MTPVDCYRGAPLRERVHVAGRWRSCPFEAVSAFVPREGRILDLGTGHGLFLLHLHTEAPGRSLVGVDIDAEKIDVARTAAAACGARVELVAGTAAEVPDGPWDAVTVLDVLYLLPAAEQEGLLRRAAAELAPGGVLVVKEMSRSPRWKFRWNRLQELLSVKVLRITAGQEIVFVEDDALPAWLSAAGLAVEVDRGIDRGYLHPHRLVVARRPG